MWQGTKEKMDSSSKKENTGRENGVVLTLVDTTPQQAHND